jgi:hypothetical protein
VLLLSKDRIFISDSTLPSLIISGSSVDSTKWSVMNRLSDRVSGELDGCIPANVRVSGGNVMLDQKHEDITIGDAIEAPKLMHYTTGHIQQKRRLSFTVQ